MTITNPQLALALAVKYHSRINQPSSGGGGYSKHTSESEVLGTAHKYLTWLRDNGA